MGDDVGQHPDGQQLELVFMCEDAAAGPRHGISSVWYDRDACPELSPCWQFNRQSGLACTLEELVQGLYSLIFNKHSYCMMGFFGGRLLMKLLGKMVVLVWMTL